VESFADDFTPEKFTDDYQAELRTLIDAKLEQGDSLDTEATFGEKPEEEGGGEVLDLMEALRRSVDSNRSSKKGGSSGSTSSTTKAAPKKGASAKAAPKKSAPKKSTSRASSAKAKKAG
jgi:DNA end-binding protein Ku